MANITDQKVNSILNILLLKKIIKEAIVSVNEAPAVPGGNRRPPSVGDRVTFTAVGYPSPLSGAVLSGSPAKGFNVLVKFAGGAPEKTFKVKPSQITSIRRKSTPSNESI